MYTKKILRGCYHYTLQLSTTVPFITTLTSQLSTTVPFITTLTPQLSTTVPFVTTLTPELSTTVPLIITCILTLQQSSTVSPHHYTHSSNVQHCPPPLITTLTPRLSTIVSPHHYTHSTTVHYCPPSSLHSLHDCQLLCPSSLHSLLNCPLLSLLITTLILQLFTMKKEVIAEIERLHSYLYLLTLRSSWYRIMRWTGLMRRSGKVNRCPSFCRISSK